MRLDEFKSKGLFLSGDPSRCFNVALSFNSLDLQTSVLIDSGASACFIDEDFIKRYKIPLIKKPCPVPVEVIDGRPLASGHVTHETIPLEIELEGHNSFLVFNVIKTPTNSVILGLSWLQRYNPDIDWENLRIKSFRSNILPSPFKPKVQRLKPLFVGARAFMRAAKYSTPFAIYATPA